MTELTNARYDGSWYFCWLVERVDLAEPQWLDPQWEWTSRAHEALWFATRECADKAAGECPFDVRINEHGFMLDAPHIQKIPRPEREQNARRILERASSWFDIQGVAYDGEISAKAKSIRDDMRRWLAGI